jgi:hypothetical protein
MRWRDSQLRVLCSYGLPTAGSFDGRRWPSSIAGELSTAVPVHPRSSEPTTGRRVSAAESPGTAGNAEVPAHLGLGQGRPFRGPAGLDHLPELGVTPQVEELGCVPDRPAGLFQSVAVHLRHASPGTRP